MFPAWIACTGKSTYLTIFLRKIILLRFPLMKVYLEDYLGEL